jgi:hypothetical protein
LLTQGRWFSLGTPASSTIKTGRHDIHVAEILLKVALNTKNKSINQSSSGEFEMVQGLRGANPRHIGDRLV